jgi:polyisoprenoid-binding protein YceI
MLTFLLLISSLVFAESRNLVNGSATYEVNYLTKTVEGTSKDVKGKIVCEKELCDFLLAVPVKSFDSGDSNRDFNMQNILDASAFPVITAKGKIKEALLSQDTYVVETEVTVHGVIAPYTVKVTGKGSSASFDLDLEKHKIDRPSLFGVKIKNQIPLAFKFTWSK